MLCSTDLVEKLIDSMNILQKMRASFCAMLLQSFSFLVTDNDFTSRHGFTILRWQAPGLSRPKIFPVFKCDFLYDVLFQLQHAKQRLSVNLDVI